LLIFDKMPRNSIKMINGKIVWFKV
jgi:hypothetical protein